MNDLISYYTARPLSSQRVGEFNWDFQAVYIMPVYDSHIDPANQHTELMKWSGVVSWSGLFIWLNVYLIIPPGYIAL